MVLRGGYRWLLLVAAWTAGDCAQLSLPAAAGPPGSSLLVPIGFLSQSDSVAGVQFDLQFDSTTLSLNATLGNSARAAGKSLYLWKVRAGLWRFLIVGLNQTALADGAPVNLFVNVGADAFPATYPLQLL